MTRWSLVRLVVGIAAAGIVVVALPDLQRYLRISRM